MSLRLASAFLAALALMLVPLAMAGGKGGGAMAQGVSASVAAAGHCSGDQPADHDKQEQKSFKTACANVCAACIATLPSNEMALPKLAGAVDALLPPTLSGVAPEGETPPPRIASEI